MFRPYPNLIYIKNPSRDWLENKLFYSINFCKFGEHVSEDYTALLLGILDGTWKFRISKII